MADRQQQETALPAAVDPGEAALEAPLSLPAGRSSPPSAREMDAAIREAFGEPDPLKRNRMLAELMEQLTPENIEAAMAAVRAAGEGPDVFRELALLTYAWGQMDPDKALAYVAERGGRGSVFGTASVLSGWASRDPDAAYSWFKDQEVEGFQRRFYARGLMDGLAQQDLEAATRLAIEESDADLKSQFLQTVTRQRVRTEGVASTRAWVEDLLADQEMGSSQAGEVAGELADRWADDDPQAAADWAGSLENEPAAKAAAAASLREWGRGDPTAASAYLNKMEPSPVRDSAIDAFASTIVREDPKAAVIWAGSIGDEEARLSAQVANAQIWNSVDPEAAQAWAKDEGFSPEAQAKILEPPPRGRR